MREYKADRAVVIDVARYGAEQLLENRRGKKNHYHGVAVDKLGGLVLGKMMVYLVGDMIILLILRMYNVAVRSGIKTRRVPREEATFKANWDKS